MSKRRVLLVSHEMSYTGAPNSLLKIAKVLREKDFDISIWTLKSGDFQREFESLGFYVTVVNKSNIENFIIYSQLSKFEIVIANTIFCMEFAFYAQFFTNTILYLREAHNIPQLIKDCNLNENYLYKIKQIVCVSEYAKAYLENEIGVKGVYVIPNFVEDEYVFEHNGYIEEISSVINFWVLGTVEKRKGQLIAVQAFNQLAQQNKRNSFLHIVGDIPEWSIGYWEQICNISNEHIVYHQKIHKKNELNAVYENADVILVPSLDESCSLVTLEACMHSKTVILTKNVGAQYLVDSEFIVETDNVNQLAAKMKYCIDNKNKLGFWGKKNRERYLEYATKEIYQRNLLSYLDLLKTKFAHTYLECVLSIIIPIYEVPNMLKQDIELLSKLVLPKYEIICVDCSKSENCKEVLYDYLEKDKNIRYISCNAAYGGAINIGFKNANGRFIQIINPVDLVNAECITKLIYESIVLDVDILTQCYEISEDYNPINNSIFKTKFLQENKIQFEESKNSKYVGNTFWNNLLVYSPKIQLLKGTDLVKNQSTPLFYADICCTNEKYYKYRLDEICQSKSYKLGLMITAIPRKIRGVINRLIKR